MALLRDLIRRPLPGEAVAAAGKLIFVLCLLAPAMAVLYLALSFSGSTPRVEMGLYGAGELVPLLLGLIAGLLVLSRGRLDPAERRRVLASPALLSPLSLLFPWAAAPGHLGLAVGGPSFFRTWLTKYPSLGPVNGEVLAGILCLLGAAFLPCLFAHLWLRCAQRRWLLAVAALGLLCWVPVAVRLDVALTFTGFLAAESGAWAGPLLRAAATIGMSYLAVSDVWRRGPRSRGGA